MSSVSRPSQRTSCSSCQKSKRGCRLLPGTLACGQCEKRGLAESCDILLYPSHYPRSCNRCSKHHKKCVKNAFGCESCSDAGLECSVSPISSGSGSVVSDFVPRHDRIDQIITAMEKSLLDEYNTEDWDIQDPDLMPTYEDYYHVQAFFKSNTVVIMTAFNVKGFLGTFFIQPPPFRLVVCAIAAYYAGPAISEETSLWFFKRARKAVILAGERPSFSSAQAYYWIYVNAKIMKKTELGLPFLRMAVDMVNALQMDIDPDDLAFPLGFNLSETEKEERRRFVWALSLLVDLEMSLSLKSGLPELSLKHIKPLTPIPGLLHTYRSYEPCIQTKHFLVAVKKHYSNVPHSIQDIFHSNSFKTLHSNIPLHNLINIEPQMFQSFDAVTMRYLVWMQLDLLASISMLYRSRLYLSALDAFGPAWLDLFTHDMIQTAIISCYDSALKMSYLVRILLQLDQKERARILTYTSLWYPVFEAAIVAWFLACRLKESWQQTVKLNILELKDVMAMFRVFVRQTMKEEAAGGPILAMMETMSIELGVSSYEDTIDVSVQEYSSNETEPLAYLGLLGLDVGNVPWTGMQGERWGHFWKENGM